VIEGKSVLAVILARGGSKRLPNKNILELGGKPLIAWSIEEGLKNKYIDNLIVSSDSENILDIAGNYGANLIKRPNELASDTASTFDAIEHTINNIQNPYDYIILLQPTSPFRTNKHIDEAFESLFGKKADAIISVTEMEHNPEWGNILPKNGSMVNFINRELVNVRSQDLDQYYRLNGAIYICKTKSLLKEKTFFIKENIYAYKMDSESSIDIDLEIDFQIAKLIIENKNNIH
jgi:CMP-N,N'-diacetyllegionaminic acid synthase